MVKKNVTLEQFKDAVWDFMLEHCDITPNGSIFVKFHCDHRANFEKRIHARVRGYHRTDVVERQKYIDEKRDAHLQNKKEKRDRYYRIKKARSFWGKFYPYLRFFYEKTNTRK